MKMHDALEVVAEGKCWSAIDFRSSAIDRLRSPAKVIVEIGGDDPEGICAAKDAEVGVNPTLLSPGAI
jgi:hypothetical protein